jgi:4'-phosphopantetheinyl transferase
MEIVAVAIDRPMPRSTLTAELARLSPDKARRLERFHRDEDLLRGLLGDLLVRRVLARSTGLGESTLVFSTGEYGKPCLVGMRGVEFNLSHSGAWVVCAVDRAPVGIDVEKIGAIDPELSRRVFTDAEHELLQRVDPARRVELFFTLWTLKESLIKMTGQGLSLPLRSFSVVASGSGGYRIHVADGPMDGVHLAASGRLAGHKLAVCGHSLPPVDALELMPMDELLAPG